MNPQIKALLGVLGGIIAGFITVMLGEQVLHSMNPMPADLNIEDTLAVNNWLKSMPVSNFVMLLAVYAVAALVAGYITNLICKDIKYKPAVIAGVGLMIAGIMNMMSLWHPTWFWVASILAYLGFSWLGGRLAPKA